jgi:cytochrome c biogenesis protein CcmG, thiol:disulfide interchange protein DsbE
MDRKTTNSATPAPGAPSGQTSGRTAGGPRSWVLTGTVLLVVAVLIVAIARGNGGQTPVPLKAGTVAPEFSLPAEQGGAYTLSQFRGKVVLLEFFAPWCPHCRAEAPTLHRLASAVGPDVQLLAVTATAYGYDGSSAITMHDVKQFVDTYHVNFPALFDQSLKVGEAYGVPGYPLLYVIDRNGVVTWNSGNVAEEPYDTLLTQIQKALLVPQGTPAPTATAHA